MGGHTFYNTTKFSLEEFDKVTELIKDCDNYLLPFRLQNKILHRDYDIIVGDTESFIDFFEIRNLVKEIKVISLFESRFKLYSKHILTHKLQQIDLLKSWNIDSLEITRAYFSYSFANIYFKQLIKIINSNLQFSFLGVFCSSNKYVIPKGVKFIDNVEPKTRLIIDCEYIFALMDLSYLEFSAGFKNEIKLLEYFEKSKYFNQIKFKNNSKFKHNYSRLKPFKNLVDLGLIKVENF